jgi:hypothetical protein
MQGSVVSRQIHSSGIPRASFGLLAREYRSVNEAFDLGVRLREGLNATGFYLVKMLAASASLTCWFSPPGGNEAFGLQSIERCVDRTNPDTTAGALFDATQDSRPVRMVWLLKEYG